MAILDLKEFQIRVLNQLSSYLTALKARKEKGSRDYCGDAWEDIKDSLPHAWTNAQKPRYRDIVDGTGCSIPNICLKVPTGGGKTLIGVQAISRINNQYFDRNTGLVVWIVPSETIYRQTLNAFKDPDHPYRKFLKLSATGRLNIIRHTDNFSLLDVDHRFTIMLIMLQSSNRQTKETLRMFKSRGGFTDFFPPVDDYPKSNRLKRHIPNLDVYKPDSSKPAGQLFNTLIIKHSLGNVMRLQKPIIVIDEGHRAYSDLARETIRGLNPRFILELSATPAPEKSNILVNVSGLEVKAEEMIKLPINLANIEGSDWQKTLRNAWEKTEDLYKQAKDIHAESNHYIRPIMLVQVERTGKKQIGGKELHAEDVRTYLVNQLGLRPDEVRVKSAELDEIGQENLLSEESSVRVVITKQALQEGWDCSFAYVLVLLSQTKATDALTQLIGRILRQPHAKRTNKESLNQSYVFCHNQNISDVVKKISNNLKKEGLEDVKSMLNILKEADSETLPLQEVKRRKEFEKLEIMLPQVLHEGQLFSLERDLLPEIPWADISYSHNDNITIGHLETLHVTETQIDIADSPDEKKPDSHKDIEIEEEVSAAFFARSLSDIIPNPWQATRIAQETIDALKKGTEIRNPYTPQNLYANRITLLNELYRDLKQTVYGHYGDANDTKEGKTEALFRKKIKDGKISFKLNNNQDLNWNVPKTITLYDDEKQATLRRSRGEIQKNLFEYDLEDHYNETLEKPFAIYLDEDQAIKWWYRLIARKDYSYSLQGWRQHRVYPDFLAAYVTRSGQKECLAVLETKGHHLSGNDDTQYKAKIFECLEEIYSTSRDAGEIDVMVNKEKIKFRIIMQNGFENQLQKLLNQH